MRLILIRHAETDGNRNTYVGREDLPLNETGRRQALTLAEALTEVQISAIYSSPLMRARDTAKPIAAASGLYVEVRPELIEIDFGNLQGQPKHTQRLDLKRHHFNSPLPGGESLRDVHDRLKPVAGELRGLLVSNQSIAVISHYWTCRVLLGHFLNAKDHGVAPLRNYKPANASALQLTFSDSRATAVPTAIRWLRASVT